MIGFGANLPPGEQTKTSEVSTPASLEAVLEVFYALENETTNDDKLRKYLADRGVFIFDRGFDVKPEYGRSYKAYAELREEGEASMMHLEWQEGEMEWSRDTSVYVAPPPEIIRALEDIVKLQEALIFEREQEAIKRSRVSSWHTVNAWHAAYRTDTGSN